MHAGGIAGRPILARARGRAGQCVQLPTVAPAANTCVGLTPPACVVTQALPRANVTFRTAASAAAVQTNMKTFKIYRFVSAPFLPRSLVC